MKNSVLLLFILSLSIVFCNCGDENFEEATLEFHPEYDYMIGYDVFPDGYVYAAKTFSGGNVNFSPTTSDADFPAYFLDDMKEIYGFIYDNAICSTDAFNQCILRVVQSTNDTLVFFQQHAYLAAIQNLTSKPIPNSLGISQFNGEKYKAFTFIFAEECNKFADTTSNIDYNGDTTKFIEATVVHELGHVLADLQHLCYTTGNGTRDINNHNNYPCAMSAKLPDVTCDQEYFNVLQFPPSFCDKCKSNLKNVTW